MPAALKSPTLDELYKRLRDLDYSQIDERMAVMLNAILQLEAQGECRKSAAEAVLMVGYTTEENFKPQKASSKKGSTNEQTWEVDVGKEWISSEHQAIGKQVTSDPLAKNATINTARPWWWH